MANKKVKIRQGNIDALLALYKSTYQKVAQEIISATTAGKINRIRVMARINKDLEDFGIDAEKWVKKEIPQYYLDGANAAVQDLRALGIDVSKGREFAAINREAISALASNTLDSFAEGIRGVSRGAQTILSDAIKQQINLTIAEGKLTGEALKTISNSVKQRLTDEGIASLVDSAGRQWNFDRYAEMLVRTKSVEARNQGLANRMLQEGHDLVQVSDSNSQHPACKKWEGAILSLTGKTEGDLPGGMEVDGTLEEAMADGLFHPNCEHAINVIVPSLAARTESYENPMNLEGRQQELLQKDYPQFSLKGKDNTVYRAIDSQNKKATLGNGTYFAFDKDNVTRYGNEISSFKLDRSSKLMDLSSFKEVGDFTDIAREFNKELYLQETIRYGVDEATSRSITRYARALGFDGIISDDEVFGGVVFDKDLLKLIANESKQDKLAAILARNKTDSVEAMQAIISNPVSTEAEKIRARKRIGELQKVMNADKVADTSKIDELFRRRGTTRGQ